MRRRYLLELVRARFPIVLLAAMVCGILRVAIGMSQAGDWRASEGQGLAALASFVLVLPVLAFLVARVEGELGAPAWMLARPIGRRWVVGLRMLADAMVLVLSAVVARLWVGDLESPAIVMPSQDLRLFIELIGAWWEAPFGADRFFEVRSSGMIPSWTPVGPAAASLVAVVYSIGLISGGHRRGGSRRGLVLSLVLVVLVCVPFVVLLAAAGLGSNFVRMSWFLYEGGVEETIRPAAWRTVAIAWLAVAPVLGLSTALGAAVVDLFLRPSAVRLGRLAWLLSFGTTALTIAVAALLINTIRSAPPLHRVGSSRFVLSVVPVGGSQPGRVFYTTWLQQVGEWHPSDPWLSQHALSRKSSMVMMRNTVELHGSTADGRRGREEIDDLFPGTYEVCAQVGPAMPDESRETRSCWRREAQTRRIEATCTVIEIAEDTDHGTIDLPVRQPQWDGTCPPGSL